MIFSFYSMLSFAFPCRKTNTKASKQTEVLAMEFMVPSKPVYTCVPTERGGPSSLPIPWCQCQALCQHLPLGPGIDLAQSQNRQNTEETGFQLCLEVTMEIGNRRKGVSVMGSCRRTLPIRYTQSFPYCKAKTRVADLHHLQRNMFCSSVLFYFASPFSLCHMQSLV